MAGSAKVLSTQALKDAKAALVEFSESVGTTLTSVDADINRMTQWLAGQVGHWKVEVRKREEEINKVKTEIMRKRIIAAPEPASVVEEEKKLRRAKARLESAQQKLENVRRWAPVWEREAMLYKTSTHQLAEAIHGLLPAAMARLERMHQSLDEYAQIAPPSDNTVAMEPGSADASQREADAAGEQP